MTLNDLERRNSPYFVFFHRIRQIFRPIMVLEDRPIMSVNTVFQFQSSILLAKIITYPCGAVSLR